MADAVAAPSVDVDAYNGFVRRAQIVALDTVQFRGQRLRPGDSPTTAYDLQSSYSISESTVYYRFDVTADLLGTDESPVALVEVGIVVAFDFEGEPPVAHVIEAFGARTVTFMVTPNLREAVNSLALRLGYPGVTMPMVTQSAADEPSAK